jgi:hypothetical protein
VIGQKAIHLAGRAIVESDINMVVVIWTFMKLLRYRNEEVWICYLLSDRTEVSGQVLIGLARFWSTLSRILGVNLWFKDR